MTATGYNVAHTFLCPKSTKKVKADVKSCDFLVRFGDSGGRQKKLAGTCCSIFAMADATFRGGSVHRGGLSHRLHQFAELKKPGFG